MRKFRKKEGRERRKEKGRNDNSNQGKNENLEKYIISRDSNVSVEWQKQYWLEN